jgi:lysozyme family protein
MADFQKALEFLFRNEGIYSDNPNDSGGETKFGISKRSYPDVDIANLTREQAADIYYTDFWALYANMPDRLALKMFDFAVNMGHKQAIKLLQRALRCVGREGVADDGILGGKTREAVAMSLVNLSEVVAALRSEAAGFYRVLAEKEPKNRVFLEGWLRRAYL